MAGVKETLATRRSSLFAVFVDFKGAFDSAPRVQTIFMLAEAGVSMGVLKLLAWVLQKRKVSITDSMTNPCPSHRQLTWLRGTV